MMPRLLKLFVLLALAACNTPEDTYNRVQPNILIAISDDQSFAHTSFSGSKLVSTPAFDQVARSGVFFMNCIAGSPGCAPSRSALITGRHHWQNEQSGQHAAGWFKKYVPVVDVLRDNGYHVGMTGKGVGPFRYAREEGDSLLREENAAGPGYYAHRYNEEYDARPANGIRDVNYAANFQDFLAERPADTPFYFWYGASEPHRRFEYQSGSRLGKDLTNAEVPGFLPDVDSVREDMLDYAVEIEWFDLHLGQMLDMLDSLGELDNTLVIVTSDNGMAFPRAKANGYDYGIHVPLAISLPSMFPQGRRLDEPVSFIDIVPTLLEVTGVQEHNMQPITGRSILPWLTSTEAIVGPKRYVFSGRERHSSTRWKNLGYPVRAIRSKEHLLIWNMKPERAPAGVPVMLDKETGEPHPPHGLQDGRYLPGTAYHDIDDCPTKTYLIENKQYEEINEYFELAVGHRPEFEFFDLQNDPWCLINAVADGNYAEIVAEMKSALSAELERTGDPRIVGPDSEIFDSYPRYSPIRNFPPPKRAQTP